MKTSTLFKFLCPFKQANRSYGRVEVIRNNSLNGMKIAAGKCSGLPLAACTVMFQAGSRNEIDDQIGASHFIRVGSSTTSARHSTFMKSRFLQQRGATITCRTDRQTIAYTMHCPVELFGQLSSYFADGAVKCMYPDHELDEVRTIIKDDLLMRTPQQIALDLVQKACFGGPLSNSIYCIEERLGTVNADVINCYVSNNFKTTCCSIGSWGVSYDDVLKIAAIVDCCNVERPGAQYVMQPSFPRGGYEVFDTGNRGDTYIAMALPGAGTCDWPRCLRHAVLAASCGTGSVSPGLTVYDQTPNMPLSYLVEDIPPTEIKAFNISYLETGCFGLIIKTRSEYARCVAYRASNFLNNLGQLNESEIQAGKNRIKVAAMLNEDSAVRCSEELALQAACDVEIDSAQSFGYWVDGVPPAEVQSAGSCLAAKRQAGQMAVAVVGDIGALPDQRELLCG